MREITINSVGRCEAKCIFESTCACHISADFKQSHTGFTPEIYTDNDKILCDTATKWNSNNAFLKPLNFNALERGFQNIKEAIDRNSL